MNKNSLVNQKLPPAVTGRRYKMGTFVAVLASLFCLAVQAADPAPVSFFHDVYPIFKRSCNGCHHPGKLKGQLDLTTYDAFQKGGKHGGAFKAGDPKSSILMEEISGTEPSMPKEGDALTKEEVALMERWIREGAKD